MRVILHLGTEKTGTTSIQSFMHSNQEVLSRYGCAYYSTRNRSDARGLSAAALDFKSFDDFLRQSGIETVDQRKAFRRSVEEELSVFFQTLPSAIHTVIISSEHFHSRLRLPANVDWLVGVLERYTKNIQALVYLRPQVDLACSYYSTALKTGAFVDLHTFVANGCKESNHYYNYERFLALWADRLGRNNLSVRKFAKSCLRQGDVVSDFCATVGLPDVKFQPLGKREKLNESLTPLGQRLLRTLNVNRYHVPTEFLGKLQRLTQFVIREFAGSGELMPRAPACALQATFDAVNEQVRQTYFPQFETLFDQVRFAADNQDTLSQLTGSQLQVVEQVIEIAQMGQHPVALELIDKVAVQLRDYGLLMAKEDPRQALAILKVAQRIRPTGFRIRQGIEALERDINRWAIRWRQTRQFVKDCRSKITAIRR